MTPIEFMASMMLGAFLLMIIFPFFGGCFGILCLLFLFFLFGFVVIFCSIPFVWLFLLGLCLYGYSLIKRYNKWNTLPDMANYLHLHPECKLPVGVACYSCHSDNLEHVGAFYKTSKYRFYVCRACGSNLFRFKVL